MEEPTTEDQNHERRAAPTTVAGGWQGLDIVNRTDHEEEEEEKNDEGFVARVSNRYPRSFHVFFLVVLPLFVLIFVAFVCGAGLAHLESQDEKEANDQAISDYRDLFFQIEQLDKEVETSALRCLDRFNSTTGSSELINRTELREHIIMCVEEIAEERDKVSKRVGQDLAEWLWYSLIDASTFNWMTCSPDNETVKFSFEQSMYVSGQWEASYQKLLEEYQGQGMSLEEAHDAARQEATGTKNCETNVAAGALFWFTVMTTIGYGHTSPSTFGGRLLVYIMGFLSILVFTALIGQAGYICVTVFDDAFLRLKLKKLVRGPLSIFFWLCTLLLWMLVVAGIFIWWAKKRANFKVPLHDSYWFTFISTTTVGLGDMYIPPDLFKAADMFFIPLLFLIGFVFLANFLLKLSGTLMDNFAHLRKGPSFETILENSRKAVKDEKTERPEEITGDANGDPAESTPDTGNESREETGDANGDPAGSTRYTTA